MFKPRSVATKKVAPKAKVPINTAPIVDTISTTPALLHNQTGGNNLDEAKLINESFTIPSNNSIISTEINVAVNKDANFQQVTVRDNEAKNIVKNEEVVGIIYPKSNKRKHSFADHESSKELQLRELLLRKYLTEQQKSKIIQSSISANLLTAGLTQSQVEDTSAARTQTEEVSSIQPQLDLIRTPSSNIFISNDNDNSSHFQKYDLMARGAFLMKDFLPASSNDITNNENNLEHFSASDRNPKNIFKQASTIPIMTGGSSSNRNGYLNVDETNNTTEDHHCVTSSCSSSHASSSEATRNPINPDILPTTIPGSSSGVTVMDTETTTPPLLPPAPPTTVTATALSRGEAVELLDNWDDEDGYYRCRLSEVIGDRYRVMAVLGRGVFSSVLRCIDNITSEVVAVKVMRANDAMSAACDKELAILRHIQSTDPDDRAHIIRLVGGDGGSFTFRGHRCLVLENMNSNLSHMHHLGYIHADIKPDNIVVNDKRNIVKLCDFGSALRGHELRDLADSPYLVARYYRSPEIVLCSGDKSSAVDVWALAITLMELYKGSVCFTGESNNDLLWNMMQLLGPIPKKIIKSAKQKQHFEEGVGGVLFIKKEVDKASGREVIRRLPLPPAPSPANDLLSHLLPSKKHDFDSSGSSSKEFSQNKAEVVRLKDFLSKALTYDPAKRISAAAGLKDIFFKDIKK